MTKKVGSRSSKPFATHIGRDLMPTIFVDFSIERCGPRLPRDKMIAIPSHPHTGGKVMPHQEPWVFNPDQAAIAAAQWGSDAPQPTDRPWLKSWNYPTDAFDPWPERSDVCCWWCVHEFEGPPFPLPTAFDKLAGRYRVLGIFCGPSCAKAYAADGDRFPNKYNIFAWIDSIAHRHYGYATPGGHAPLIPRAPRRELLQKFCGPKGLTIKQYRTLCAYGRSLRLHRPGFITEKQIVEASNANAMRITEKAVHASYHPENPDRIQTATELVNIKRPVFAGRGAKPLSSYFSTNK